MSLQSDSRESLPERIDRLIGEGGEIIPSITSGRGSFSTMPPGYNARHPGDWQREFLEVLPTTPGSAFRPDADQIYPLVALLNDVTLGNPPPVPLHVAVETLSTALGYVMFEMLIRRLTPAVDDWGYLTQPVSGLTLDQPVSGLGKVLDAFMETTAYEALRDDLGSLNSQMMSSEYGRSGSVEPLDLYGRIVKGRNLMLHGNLSHSFEGTLLVLLVDFIVLHVAKQDLSDAAASQP